MLKTQSGKEVSKIGIGTWTIKKENIDKEVEALKFYFKNGVNFIDVVLAYDNGLVLDVVAKFLQSVKREDIFINGFITHGCKNIEDVEKQIGLYLEKLNIDYLDCLTLHSPAVIGFSMKDYVKEIDRLKKTGKFLNVGMSNLSPKQFKKFSDNIQIFEGLYNLECKINEDTKTIEKCYKQGIAFYAFQPLRRNRTTKQNYPEVVALAEKYEKTQNQILLNWMLKHKGIGVVVKSSNKQHIKENLGALDFDMGAEDYASLDKFRNTYFDRFKVTYKKEEKGKIRIDQIPNQPFGIL